MTPRIIIFVYGYLNNGGRGSYPLCLCCEAGAIHFWSAPDAAPEAAPDAAPDEAQDAAPNAAPNAAPDAAPNAAPARLQMRLRRWLQKRLQEKNRFFLGYVYCRDIKNKEIKMARESAKAGSYI